MDSEERDRELGQPGAQQLLATAQLVRLAYAGPDGRPRVIPIGFLWTGTEVVICTATTSPKARALAARPDVALTIDDGSTPWEARSLQLRGTAVLDTVDGVPDEYLAAAGKVMDDQQLAEFARQVRGVYPQMVRIRVAPRWARFYDFGAGRLPSFLAELVAG
jgi:hypothetical protein